MTFATFATSPRLIDLILVFTVLEAVVITIGFRRRHPPVWPSFGFVLLPGICLMLAVRAALAGAAWPWVPTALAAALVAHLLDLWVRWRR